MKISVITVCHNSEGTIEECLESVSRQTYDQIEHIIIDGGSSDGTLGIIRQFESDCIKVFSGRDDGIYDAMNKGFYKASGDVIAYLNSDDFYSSSDVLYKVMCKFKNPRIEYVYGDIEYIDDTSSTVRSWVVGEINSGVLTSQQIPHPAFFCRRDAIGRLPIPFDSKLKICGDLKQQLLLLNVHNIQGSYLNEVLAIMRLGGASTSGLRSSLTGWREAVEVFNEVEGRGGLAYVVKKVFRKISGLAKRFNV